MKQIKSPKVILLVMFTLCKSFLFSQTIIDYQSWTSSSGCNIFSDPNNASTVVNVPATINGTAGTVAHLTAIGQPTYDNANKTVNLDSRIVNNSLNNGTEYRMTVNFKQGYTYKITVTAIRIMSQQTGANVLLRLDLNNGGSGTNNLCSGTGVIDASGSGNLKLSQQITGSSFASNADYVFDYLSLSAAQPYLMIAAIPPSGSVLQTILIRKIKIEETPPPVSFTLASPIGVVCGKANPVNLAVTNVYGTPGVTGYTWNLGAANKWIYNGNPAPATISTTGNTLTLSPICGTTPTSLTATAIVGTNSYTTNTPAITPVTETLSITGTNPLCSGTATYSIANLPTCGATVSNWNAIPGGIVQVAGNGNTANVTKLANGQVTLTATVTLTNACNTSTVNLSLPLSSGAFPLTGYYFVNSNYNQPNQNTLGPNNAAIFLPANQYFAVTAYISNANIPSPSWARATSSYPFTWSSSGIQLNFSGYSGTVAYSQRNGTFDFTANTGCGLTTTTFNWPVIPTSSSFRVVASPNPATNNLVVSIESEAVVTKVSGKSTGIIITLYNLTSTEVVKSWTYKSNQTKFNLDVSSIKKGIYILKVTKDKQEQTKQISIE